MMIVISAIEAGECVVLNSDSQLVKENTRRLSRSATLDGGAVISDGGVTDADRSFDFTAKQVPEETRETLWAMFQNENCVHLSCAEGVFAGYLQRVRIMASDVNISFMVYEKLT